MTDCGGGGDTIPIVSLTVPAEGQTVSGTINLTATASDDHGVTGVEFLIDTISIGDGTQNTDGDWVLPWDTTAWVDGSHSVTAVVTDTIDQTSSDTNNVIVDNLPQPTVHIADLDDVSTPANGRWDATVRITVTDSDGNPVNGRVVSGTWSNGASGDTNCTTNSNGQCDVTKANLKNNVSSVVFTVTSVSGAYDPLQNTDPDGDSNGTTINVCNGDCVEPTGTVHIADLDGAASPAPGNGSKWNVEVTATAQQSTGEAASGVTIVGVWSDAASGSGSCTTGSDGMCSIGKNNLRDTLATFTVTDIQDPTGVLVYEANDNYDPDGDSTGTEISVPQP